MFCVCCCCWGATLTLGAPFGHRQLGEKLESKGQGGKEERLEPSWKRGQIPHPAPEGAGDEEASPADGFSGGCSEFFSVGKVWSPDELLFSKVCSSPDGQAAREASWPGLRTRSRPSLRAPQAGAGEE